MATRDSSGHAIVCFGVKEEEEEIHSSRLEMNHFDGFDWKVLWKTNRRTIPDHFGNSSLSLFCAVPSLEGLFWGGRKLNRKSTSISLVKLFNTKQKQHQ